MNTTEISIRKAERADIPEVIELWKEHLDYHAMVDPFFKRAKGSEISFQEYLNENLSKLGLFVAINGESIVGFILLEEAKRPPCFVNREYGMISDIAVSNDFRHKGIGQRLLKEAMPWFVGKNIKRIETRILDANALSTKFWTDTGFKAYMSCAFREI